MNRGMALFATALMIFLCFIYYYTRWYPQKGLGNKHSNAGLNNSIPSKTKTFEQTGTDDSTTNAKIRSPRSLELDYQKNKAKEIRNKFVAIDTWPLDWQEDPNKSGELLPQDPNSQQLQTDKQNSADFMTPQSFLKEHFRSTNELYKGWAKSLEKQEMNTNEHNKRLYGLQKEYDEKIRNIFRRKQELDMTEKLIKTGSIPMAKGYEMMWKKVLPRDAFAAMSPKIKSQGSKQYSLPVTPCVVTGIIHSETKPMAIVDGNVIGEGETIRGVRIVKVHQESVEFENAGKTWSQGINDPPSTNWP